MEDKIRGVYFDENSDGVPKIGFTTSKDTYIVTFGEALEWWRQSDQAYHRHPLQLSLDSKNAIKLRDKTDYVSFDWRKCDDGQIRLSVYVGNVLVHSMMPNWGKQL